MLFEAVDADFYNSVQTGHCDPRSLKIYKHLRGEFSRKQQRDILQDLSNHPAKSQKLDHGERCEYKPSVICAPRSIARSTERGSYQGYVPSAMEVSSIFSNIRTMHVNSVNITINSGRDDSFPSTNDKKV